MRILIAVVPLAMLAVVMLFVLPERSTRKDKERFQARVADLHERELLFSLVHEAYWEKPESIAVFDALERIKGDMARTIALKSLGKKVGKECWRPEEREKLIEVTGPLQGTLRAFEELLDMPGVHSALAGEWPIAERQREFHDLRVYIDLLCSDALVAVTAGDDERAARRLANALDLAWILDDGSLIGLAARRAFEGSIVAALQYSLVEGDVDPEPFADALAARFVRHLQPERGRAAVTSELDFLLASADEAVNVQHSFKDVLLGGKKPLLGLDTVNEMLDSYVTLYEVWGGTCLSEDEMLDCMELDHPISRLGATNAVTCLTGDHAGQRRLQLARFALGLHAYQKAFGSLPESLDALDAWGEDWPADPCVQRPFLYRPVGESYVLELGDPSSENEPHPLPDWDGTFRWDIPAVRATPR